MQIDLEKSKVFQIGTLKSWVLRRGIGRDNTANFRIWVLLELGITPFACRGFFIFLCLMRMDVLDSGFLKSVPKELRLEGEKIFNSRKKAFAISKQLDDSWMISLPESKISKNQISVLLDNMETRIALRCACDYFRNFHCCKHIVAAVIFINKEKLISNDGQLREKDTVVSANANNYSLSFLIHNGMGEVGMKIVPVLSVEKSNGREIQRFAGMPHLKSSLIAKLPIDVAEVIGELESGPKGYAIRIVDEETALRLYRTEVFLEKYRQFYFAKLSRIWSFLSQYSNVFSLNSPTTFKQENLHPVSFGTSKPVPEFFVSAKNDDLIVQLKFSIDGVSSDLNLASSKNHFFIVANDKYYLLANYEEVKLVETYKTGFLKFPIDSKFDTYLEVIAPLEKKYKVTIDPSLGLNFKKVEPEPCVLVAEYLDAYLMMIPHFVYEDQMVAYDDKLQLISTIDGAHCFISRDLEFEKAFYEKLRALHPSFTRQLQQPFYYVPFNDVMKASWFLKTIRNLQEDNIQVKGFDKLKKFKYKINKPQFKMGVSSGIDWFELKMKLTFDNVDVPLQDIQNSIFSGQKMVVLGDGSIGVLPEEWLAQFESLLMMGKVKGDKLIVNKKHFNLLLDVDLHIKEEKMLLELKEKKQALINVEVVQFKPLSKGIKATLRPYQLNGFQWMQSLDHLGWGGCLADDMGLGKTLQTISFLQFVKEKNKDACSLVICPTSLIYNWESELQKFAPALKYKIHYGLTRNLSEEHLKEFDVVLTSYGSVRNDIEELQKYEFQYIILDESQVIKNPEARTTKACMLLNAKNRLILSGTPIQNNTYDLYAQMNFLNPGFLGNKNFFKNHFAVPIDKYQDKDVIRKLRKLTEPFILRRTKEKVANDLPDKSEIVLWCHMKEKQREVYDRYKLYYRSQLLSKIEEDGIKKASFYILEGLTRLRQICDSPVLVKDPQFVTDESAKLNELLREVVENTGDHKVLIFSQFTEMLSLIKKKFDQTGISYNYLDGQTPGKTRMELVKNFQEDESVKAFLISLKAGGVGLNLTAADYVYLVDPWWNPAAESQAIDRTHRIGQTRKVFAYKMICKDSIEEKILHLQEKKKSLSKDLIGEDSSFVSKLTKDDIEFLFE